MEQIIFYEIQHKYIIDTSAILEQKSNGSRSRNIYKGLWKRIDEYIKNKKIVICSEIEDEVQDKDIKDLLHSLECDVIPINDSVQHNVIKLVTENKDMISFGNRSKFFCFSKLFHTLWVCILGCFVFKKELFTPLDSLFTK